MPSAPTNPIYDPPVSSVVKAEIARQMRLDEKWHGYQAVLGARIAAVADAQRALAKRELGAGPALRQALVDLASIAELLASELPRPRH